MQLLTIKTVNSPEVTFTVNSFEIKDGCLWLQCDTKVVMVPVQNLEYMEINTEVNYAEKPVDKPNSGQPA